MGQASDYFTRKAVKVRVLHTSNLKANTNVVHPFVRMHLVSLKTGVYLQKADYQLISSINANSVYQSEQATTLQNVPGGKQRCETRSLDFIPPFATNACDLRAIGKSRAEWYEDIIVNADLERLVDNDVLLPAAGRPLAVPRGPEQGAAAQLHLRHAQVREDAHRGEQSLQHARRLL